MFLQLVSTVGYASQDMWFLPGRPDDSHRVFWRPGAWRLRSEIRNWNSELSRQELEQWHVVKNESMDPNFGPKKGRFSEPR